MEKKVGSIISDAGNVARSFIGKSKDVAVQAIDQNDDGKFVIENINENNVDESGKLFTGLSSEAIPDTGEYSVMDKEDEL